MEKQPSLLNAIWIMVIIGGMIFWWVNSLPNEDPLWFLRSFKARADWITIYVDGQSHMFFPGDPGYKQIMEAFADAVANWSGYENSVGMSTETLETYRNQGLLLEVHFNEPVQVHTRHMFPKARNFWVPLTGTHARWRRVFAGLTEEPRIGALNISEARFETLQSVVRSALGQSVQTAGWANHTVVSCLSNL